jgi:hypothetical protein
MRADACTTPANPMTRLVRSKASCSPPSSTPRAAPRWPSAMLDRGCARRLGMIRRDGETAPASRTKKHPWLRISRNERGPFLDADGGPFCVPIDSHAPLRGLSFWQSVRPDTLPPVYADSHNLRPEHPRPRGQPRPMHLQTAAVAGTFPSDVLAGLIGAFAVDSSPPSTAIVHESGGRSQIASLTAVAVMVALAVAAAGLMAYVPTQRSLASFSTSRCSTPRCAFSASTT